MPREHGRKNQDGVGDPFGRQLGQLAEDKSEHDHGEQRPDDAPGDADGRLFIAHEDVSPRDKIEQLTVAPQVLPVVFFGAARFDDQSMWRRIIHWFLNV